MATQLTGDFWDRTDREKPVGLFDPHAGLDFPFVCNYWLDPEGKPFDLDPDLCSAEGFGIFNCEIRSIVTNVIVLRITTVPDAAIVPKKKYPFRLDFGILDGQHDQRTFWLLVKDR